MLEVNTENKFGSDCSGSDGDINRVLTLSNMYMTIEDGFMTAVGGFVLAYGTDYTVTHNATHSTITFLNPVYNTSPITVLYFVSISVSVTPGLSNKILYLKKIIASQGQAATLTRIIPTLDNAGGVTAYTNTDYNIRWLQQPITEKDRNIVDMGLAIAGDQKAFFYPYYTSTDMGVVGPSISVIVGDVITDSNSIKWRVEQKLGGRIADGTEIFGVTIVRRMILTN